MVAYTYSLISWGAEAGVLLQAWSHPGYLVNSRSAWAVPEKPTSKQKQINNKITFEIKINNSIQVFDFFFFLADKSSSYDFLLSR